MLFGGFLCYFDVINNVQQIREKKELIAKFYRPCDLANFALCELLYLVTKTTQMNIKYNT